MKKVILKIGGMSCSACQNRVEKYLNKQDGVSASVNLVMANALIEYDEEKIKISDLERFIEESGYKSLGIFNEIKEEKDNTKQYLSILAFIVIILMYISMSHMLKLPSISFLNIDKYPVNYGISLLLLTVPFIIFGFDIIKSGITKLIHKSPNMDTLVTLGVLSSFIYSLINLISVIFGNNSLAHHLYFESCGMIIYFIKLGRFIDKNSEEKSKKAIKELVQITPKSALKKTEKGEEEITIDEVKKDDILICKPGTKIAVDGIIVNGKTHIDEAFITGESKPSKKIINDKVLAGSINLDGYIEYKAEKIGPNSMISEIVRLVIEGTNTKPKLQRLADIISGYFVPIIMIISILTFIFYIIIGRSFNESITSFVSVLVIACPCALGLATPLAVVISEGKSAKEGILIKNSETLENAYKIDTVVFDKTGTLTYGKLKIFKINNYSNYSNNELLKIIASIENKSSHPIANAFKDYNDSNIKIDSFENIPGIGLSGIIDNKKIYLGNNKIFNLLNIKNNHIEDENELSKEGNSIIYVTENKKIIALIGVKDIIRESSKETIIELKKMNKEAIMLTGDNEKTASIIANELGIENVIAGVLPKEKEKVVKDLIKKGHNVLMVGDGINDAPSLTASNIGLSIDDASDIAGDSADVIITRNDLTKIISLMKMSQKTTKIIKQNLFWSFFYNILMIPIAVGLLKPFGISITPMFSAISMTLSSLIVVFNSLRLNK
ncbi:MAG: copper-translocating P-type ATPase [Bacilli bacterium]|nr:copper-translocating P-type ATPase [Bacilli bacterium]